MLKHAREANPSRYEFALAEGADIDGTPDGRSFYLLWFPIPPGPSRVFVTLHDPPASAFDEFQLWHPYGAKHGLGILALQWWFGKGEDTEDRYTPEVLYPLMETVLKKQGIGAGQAILHGVGRGAAMGYALTALDRKTGNNFFGLVIANLGGTDPEDPSTSDISSGVFGSEIFHGTNWVLFCAGRDPRPEQDGCPAMHRTASWIESLGGNISLLIEDPQAAHGGFHRNSAYVDTALEVFLNK